MKRNIIIFSLVVLLTICLYFLLSNTAVAPQDGLLSQNNPVFSDPLTIAAMRKRAYPGSGITVVRQLSDESDYHQYLTYYYSDGLKIYALLTVPIGAKPAGGWPVILFNHGYIPPETYQTTPSVGQYASYTPYFSSAGYIVFKPDYRGNGNSEGSPEGAYYSPAYAIDDLNALSSIKKYKGIDPSTGSGRFVDPNRIGVWGHSMGGNITLRDLVVDPKDIKVAVIWGGVVGSYYDLMNNWQRRVRYIPSPRELALRNASRQNLLQKYGSPSATNVFWNSADPTNFLHDITTPIQLHTGGDDEEVPVAFSESLFNKLKTLNKTVELYVYPGDNHNISGHLNEAMQRSLDFFNNYLK